MNRAEVLRSAYLIARNQRSLSESAWSAARMEVDRHEKNVAHYTEVEKGLKDCVCSECLGYGYIRVQHDQDDIKSEQCDRCKGTGLPKETHV